MGQQRGPSLVPYVRRTDAAGQGVALETFSAPSPSLHVSEERVGSEERPMTKRSARPGSAEMRRRRTQEHEAAKESIERADAVIELESEGSFPASDAPSWTVVRVGHPARNERKR
jgi:hypothetical protein